MSTMLEIKQKMGVLDLPIQETVFSKPIEEQQKIYDYLVFVKDNILERKAYIIAYHHLGTSFNILKSIGYVEWMKSNKN